ACANPNQITGEISCRKLRQDRLVRGVRALQRMITRKTPRASSFSKAAGPRREIENSNEPYRDLCNSSILQTVVRVLRTLSLAAEGIKKLAVRFEWSNCDSAVTVG